MIKLVASDVDGTLMGQDDVIPQMNINAVQAITKSPVNFAICTGKPYSVMQNMCHKLNANYGIFGNGNQIIELKTGKEIYRNVLKKEEIETCLKMAKERQLHVHLYSENSIITPKLLYMDLRNFLLKDTENTYQNQVKFEIVADLEEYVKENKQDIFKIAISGNFNLESLKQNLQKDTNLTIYRVEKYREFKDTVINKEYEYLDITPGGTNKNEALKVLSKYLGLSASEIMAIGDNLNDIEMIKNSGVGVAVANAYEEVKKVASYTTIKNASTGGFAEAVYKYVSFDEVS